MRKFKFLQRTGILLLLLLFASFTARATVIPIPATPDSLENFLEIHTDLYADGDTILLVDAAYVDSNVTYFYHSITIMGDPLLLSPPVVQFLDNGFRFGDDSLSLVIKGLVLNGFNADSSNRAPFITLCDLADAGDSIFGDIIIEDVEAYGFRGGIDLFQDKHAVYENIIVNNVFWHDFGQGNGEYLIDPNINHIKNLEVTNSTFANIQYGFLKNPDFRGQGGVGKFVPKTWLVEHNTFYKVGGFNQSFIQVNDPNDTSVTLTFKHNIVSKLYNPANVRPFRINASAGNFYFQNSIVNNFLATDPAKDNFNLDSVDLQTNVYVENVKKDDPLFADTTNLDFTPGIVVMGSDAQPIGDPRWNTALPNLTCYRIGNDYIGIIEDYIETSGIMDDGDTLMLTSSDTYIETGTIDIFAEVTVMGDPDLLIRPEVRFYDSGFRPKQDSISITLKNMRLNGLKENGTARAGYFLRFDQVLGAFNNIVVENIEAYKFAQCIQFSKSTWVPFESVTINNCIMRDITGKIFEMQKTAQKDMKVTNSTFAYFGNAFMDNPYWDGNGARDTIHQNILVERNTFYHMLPDGTQNRFIQMNDPNDSAITYVFKNNIVSTLIEDTTSRPFDLNVSAGTFYFGNSVFHNFKSVRDGGKYNIDSVADQSNVDTLAIYTYDPQFKDTADYSWPMSSPMLTAADDGGALGDPRWVPFVGVDINVTTLAMVVGEEVQLTADVVLLGPGDITVTWSVDNYYGGTNGYATINDTGLITADTAGLVKVVAVSNEDPAYFDTLIVSIIDSIHVTGITLVARNSSNDIDNTIETPGGTLTITATVAPVGATDKSLTWSVAGEGGANITPLSETSITLTGVASGLVTVTATANDNGVKGTIDITITNQEPVDSIIVTSEGDVDTIDIAGDTLQMIATVYPANADNDSVAWSVSDTSLASISATGSLIAKKDGSVTVTAAATDGSSVTGTKVIVITNQVGIYDAVADAVRIMPNPAKDYIRIESENRSEVTIVDLAGKVLIHKMVEANSTVQLNSLQSGLYIVNVTSGDFNKTFRLVKE